MGQKTRAAQNLPMICSKYLAGRLSPALLWVGPGQISQFAAQDNLLREKKPRKTIFVAERESAPTGGAALTANCALPTEN